MAVVQGIREKVHYPLYDSYTLAQGENLVDLENRVLRFFIDVQGKTKLETNMQTSATLVHQNTFEVRAIRVVVGPAGDFDANARNDILTRLASELIYNTVTSLIVGEKTMIEMPTYWFPSGAGVSADRSPAVNGFPDPMATFRLAEPASSKSSRTSAWRSRSPAGNRRR